MLARIAAPAHFLDLWKSLTEDHMFLIHHFSQKMKPIDHTSTWEKIALQPEEFQGLCTIVSPRAFGSMVNHDYPSALHDFI